MSKIGVFGHFLENRSLKVSNFSHAGRGQWGHHLSVVPYLGKILIGGLRGIKYQKSGFFHIFFKTDQ